MKMEFFSLPVMVGSETADADFIAVGSNIVCTRIVPTVTKTFPIAHEGVIERELTGSPRFVDGSKTTDEAVSALLESAQVTTGSFEAFCSLTRLFDRAETHAKRVMSVALRKSDVASDRIEDFAEFAAQVPGAIQKIIGKGTDE